MMCFHCSNVALFNIDVKSNSDKTDIGWSLFIDINCFTYSSICIRNGWQREM